jgi:hypothetical protein
LLCLGAAAPLLIGAGIVNTRAGGDAPFLVMRVQQLLVSLRSGAIPARWMPDAAQGLGYPFYAYYAAFPYYVAALLAWAGSGVLWGIKLTQALGMLLAGGALYRLARELGASPPAALLASTVYTFAPFHLVNVYVRGDALSEFYAYALYPPILLALRRVVRAPSPGGLALAGGSYALLILSHNISALLFSPLALLWVVGEALTLGEGRWRRLAVGGGALVLGLALSAWFWLPALREQPYVQLQDQTTGYFHYAGHFRAANLVQGNLLHNYALDAQHDPFAMGLVQTMLAALGLAAWAVRAAIRRRVVVAEGILVLALLGSTWLITPSSRWVWEHVPLLPYTQFPWRLLSVQALAAALLTGQIVPAWPGRGAPSEGARGAPSEDARGVGILAIALALVAAMGGLGSLRVARLPLGEGEITPQNVMLYETYSGNIGTTVRYEYLPREMVPRPFVSAVQLNDGFKPAPLVLEGTLRRATLQRATAESEQWQLELETPALLAFHTAYFPGWQATVDGVATPVEALAGLGQIGLRLPAGEHTVTLRLGLTRVRRGAAVVSGLALAIAVGLLLYPARHDARARRRVLLVAGGVLLIGVWLATRPGNVPAATAPTGPRVADFMRAPYLHAEAEGVQWGEAWLREYVVDTATLAPGGVLTITLRWQEAQPPLRARVALLGVTAHLFEHAPTWAEAELPLTDTLTTLCLALPEQLPPGLYLPQLTVWRAGESLAPHTPRGEAMSTLALAPVQVREGRRATGREAVLAAFGPENAPPVISLLEARPLATQPGLATISLTWRSERQAPLNYMLSLRLNRADGSRVAARDVAPFLGGYPTSLWQPGELLSDRVALPLPAEANLAAPYTLEVVLYDRATLQASGTATLKDVSLAR